jgi:hypothetical protein
MYVCCSCSLTCGEARIGCTTVYKLLSHLSIDLFALTLSVRAAVAWLVWPLRVCTCDESSARKHLHELNISVIASESNSRAYKTPSLHRLQIDQSILTA